MGKYIDIDFEKFLIDATAEINSSADLEELKIIKSKFIGKKSLIFKSLKTLKNENIEIKRTFIPKIQDIRSKLEDVISKRKSFLESKLIIDNIGINWFDPTITTYNNSELGVKHPISKSIEEIVNIFKEGYFDIVRGPEIETKYYNFDALNFPSWHPALAKKDSFWLTNNTLLRTHTSGIQIKIMNTNKPPFKIISPGRVYRPDSDTTHTPMFHQIEGFVVDKGINFSNLKWCLENFLYKFFEGLDIEIRFRPSYFPFTVPSGEIDIKFKDSDKWLEVLGCGMIHPRLFEETKIDHTKYKGFAFGMGIERLTMIKYNLKNLSTLFENDTRFLKQFL